MINEGTKEKYINKYYGKLYAKDIYKKDEINFAVSNCTSIERHKILFNKYKSILPKHIINAYEEFITSLGENR